MKRHVKMNGKINQALGLLTEAAQEKRAELYENLGTKVDDLRHKIEGVSTAVKEKGGVIRRRTEAVVGQSKKKVERSFRHTVLQIDRSIHHHPWEYLGGIAAIAFLYGFSVAHRRKIKAEKKSEKQEEAAVTA